MKREYVKELHKQAYKPRVYRKVVSLGLDDTWSIDLVDMRYIDGKDNEGEQRELNDGYQYIFMCIDLFSRYAWAVPMKDKTTTEAWHVFSEILKSGRKPKKIWADQGGEFHSDYWEKRLKDIGVKLYYTGSGTKAVMVERLNKTIKTWMWAEFSYYDDVKKWIDLLPKLIDRYNKRVHSAIGMTPNEAVKLKKSKLKALEEKQYKGTLGAVGEPKYKVLDYVRISKTKGKFEKGYTEKWSREIYKIVAIDLNKPIKYHLVDEDDEPVKGSFYESEVQATGERAKPKPPPVDYVKVLGHEERPLKKGGALFSNYIMNVDFGDGGPSFADAPLKNHFAEIIGLRGEHDVSLGKFMKAVPGEKGKRILVYTQKYVKDNLPDIWKEVVNK